MNTFSMAVKNLKKNLSFYSLYLVSAAFVITVFFAFTSFSVNTVMLEKISTDGRVETMCHTISLFLMVFVVFIWLIPTDSFCGAGQRSWAFMLCWDIEKPTFYPC